MDLCWLRGAQWHDQGLLRELWEPLATVDPKCALEADTAQETISQQARDGEEDTTPSLRRHSNGRNGTLGYGDPYPDDDAGGGEGQDRGGRRDRHGTAGQAHQAARGDEGGRAPRQRGGDQAHDGAGSRLSTQEANPLSQEDRPGSEAGEQTAGAAEEAPRRRHQVGRVPQLHPADVARARRDLPQAKGRAGGRDGRHQAGPQDRPATGPGCQQGSHGDRTRPPRHLRPPCRR